MIEEKISACGSITAVLWKSSNFYVFDRNWSSSHRTALIAYISRIDDWQKTFCEKFIASDEQSGRTNLNPWKSMNSLSQWCTSSEKVSVQYSNIQMIIIIIASQLLNPLPCRKLKNSRWIIKWPHLVVLLLEKKNTHSMLLFCI